MYAFNSCKVHVLFYLAILLLTIARAASLITCHQIFTEFSSEFHSLQYLCQSFLVYTGIASKFVF